LSLANAAKDTIPSLATKLESVETEVHLNSKEIRNFKKIYKIVIGTIGFVGFATLWGFSAYVRRKVKKIVDKAIYKVDPTYLEVKVPRDNFTYEARKLTWLGFKNFKTYPWLDNSCLAGCVIYKADNDHDAITLQKFIKDKKPDEHKVGYVLYTRARIDHSLFEEFNNVTFANSPLTLINAVYAVARGIVK